MTRAPAPTPSPNHRPRAPQPAKPAKPAKPAQPIQLPTPRPDAGAADIGAREIWAALPPEAAPQPVRRFGTFTADLQALALWFREHGVTTVALEATGVYWIPLFQILEAHGLAVCLVNARHVKRIRRPKTDIADCQWLQYLHAVGLLQPSFRPPDAICALRSLLRHRDSLVAQGAKQIQHMQKALTQMNLQIHHVLADISGVSGLRILDALLAGERDPAVLATLCDPGVKASPETVCQALRGDWRREHLFVLGQARAHYRYLQEQLVACDQEIERLLAEGDSQADPHDVPPPPKNAGRNGPRKNQLRLEHRDLRTELFRLFGTDLTQVPGLGPLTVVELYGELGPELKGSFPTSKQFCSWLGLCPDPQKSGGKVLKNKTREVKHRVATAFRLAVHSLHHSDTPLGRFLRRMQAKLGKAEGITATAHKLARIFYHLVTTKEAYDESVFARQEQRDAARELKRLRQRAQALGYTLNAVAPA